MVDNEEEMTAFSEYGSLGAFCSSWVLVGGFLRREGGGICFCFGSYMCMNVFPPEWNVFSVISTW